MNENLIETPTYDIYWKKKLKSPKDISYSGDGNHLLIGSNDGRVYFLNKEGTELWQQSINNITCLDLSGDSSKIITGTYSGSLYLFSKGGSREWEKKVNGSINSLSISDDGKNICIGTDKGIIIDLNEAGDELWKHKIKGASDGGICHSHDGKSIVVGSWDTVYFLNVDGKIIWKFKFNKKITDVCVAENASLIAVCTKGSIGFIGNEGNLISEKTIANGFKSASICDNLVYATFSNNVYIFNDRGEQLTSFEVPEGLIKICVNSKEFISAISESRVYMLSSLMRPQVNVLTNSLTIGEKQPLEVELVNNSLKELEFELELRSNGLTFDNFKSIVRIPAKGRSNAGFMVIPGKIGKCSVEFLTKNKNIKPDKTIIEIVPPEIELKISHQSKYDFNAEDDEITMIVDIENTGKATAKKIHVVGYDSLFLPELKPGTKGSLTYKIKLPSGNHSLSKNIACEDGFGGQFNCECPPCNISVEKAPYVWGLKQPVPRIVNGKPAIVKYNLKNLKNDVLNLIFNVASEKIEIKPNNIQVQLNPSEIRDIDLTFTPKGSDENIKLDITIEYEGKKQNYSDEIKVYPGPPHINIRNQMPKDKYRLGEEIYETLELINEGESPAINIQLEGIQNIPILEPKSSKLVNRPCPNNEVKYYRSVKNIIKYEDELEEYSTEFYSSAYTVLSPGLKIRMLETNLKEDIKEIKFDIENISNEVMKDLIVELLINDDRIVLEKPLVTIETLNPNAAKPAIFQCVSHREGVMDYNIYVKHQSIIIEQQSGTIMAGLKTPVLKFEADDREMLQNEYSLLKLRITNIGETDARDINIKLQSEIDKKLSKEAAPSDYSQLKEIKPGESKEITFGFHPTTAGKVSLTIISSCKSAYGKNLPEKKEQAFVTIRPQISKPETIVHIGELTQGSTVFKGGAVVQNSKISAGSKKSNEPEIRDEITQDSIVFKGDAIITKSQSPNLDAYRKQAIAVFRKGKITSDERGLLDVLRVNYGLTREQQKQIETEILEQYSVNKTTVNETIERVCTKCGRTMQKGVFCVECGTKLVV